MLRHLRGGGVGEMIGYKRSAWALRRWHLPMLRVSAHPSVRWMNQTAAAQPSDGDSTPQRLPGTPAPGREQTVGEAFAAMQYHGRGTRKIKARVLHSILKRLSSEEELKYAFLGLELFKKQGIKLTTEAGGLFIKACCRAGSSQAAVNALGQAEKYGLDEEHVVGPNRFNYLLGHLYKAGDEESFRRAVADAKSRRQVLNEQSHFLIDKFEAEVRAREEEEEKTRLEAEEAKVKQEADEAKAKQEAEEAKAKQEADEAKAKQEADEAKAKQKAEEAKAKQAAEETKA